MKIIIRSLFVTLLMVLFFQTASLAASMSSGVHKIPTNTIATGTSELSQGPAYNNRIVYVIGQPSAISTSESSTMVLQYGYIYTLSTEAVGGNLAYVRYVKVNGVSIRNGDYLGPEKTNDILIEVSTSASMITCEAWIDDKKIPLSGTSGILYPAWTGGFVSPGSAIRTHYITVFTSTDAYEQGYITYEVQVVGGSVQTMDKPLNYPNPFRPGSAGQQTTIMYSLNNDAQVSIYLYDITGQEIKRWAFASSTNGGRAGINSVAWDGKSIFGSVAGNGMYIYKIISKDKVIGSGKIVILD